MSVIAIRNGRIIDPANGVDQVGDVFVAGRRIIEKCPDGKAIREIDAGGLIVCPGLIDLKADVGVPAGPSDTSTIDVESQSAVNGGITTVCIQPDTTPVIDTPAMAQMIRQRTTNRSGIRVLPLGALTVGLAGESLTNMASLMDAGCAGLSNAGNAVRNTLVMRRAMQYAATFGITVFMQSHDPWLTGNGCVHEGEISTRLGLPSIPEAAETVAIARDVALVQTTGVEAHFSQLSCGRSADMINEAQQRGSLITADVAIHNLHLTEHDTRDFNTLCHVRPPLRSMKDRARLRAGLCDGTIAAICSDHQPCRIDDKLAPFSQSAPGISGLETLLPLTLRLVDEGVIDLSAAIGMLSSGPAQILGIEGGNLAFDSPADICIFDPDEKWLFNPAKMASRGKNNPFGGWEMRGSIRYTIVNGRVIKDQSNR